MTPRLDLGKVIAGAFLVPWWRRRAFARALAIPLALIIAYCVACSYAWPQLPQFALWLAWPLYGLLFSLFAVTCHRLVLLDADEVAKRWRPGWSWRETRFFLWMASVWGLGLVASGLLLTLAVNIATWFAGRPSEETLGLIVHLWKIPAVYVFARLCMLFPATAVDRRHGLRWSWELTRGNGWRLLMIVGGVAVEIAAISLSYRELTRDEPQLSTTATT